MLEGKVTFEGKAVTEGRVTFHSPAGLGDAEAMINKDGTFAVGNPLVVGDYDVVITPLTHIVDTDPGKSPPVPVEKPAPDVPIRYRQPGTTTLKAKVDEGKNVIELKMTRDP